MFARQFQVKGIATNLNEEPLDSIPTECLADFYEVV